MANINVKPVCHRITNDGAKLAFKDDPSIIMFAVTGFSSNGW